MTPSNAPKDPQKITLPFFSDPPSYAALERRALHAVSNTAKIAALRASEISEDSLILIRASRHGDFDKTEDLPALRISLQDLKAAVESLEASLIALEELEGSQEDIL